MEEEGGGQGVFRVVGKAVSSVLNVWIMGWELRSFMALFREEVSGIPDQFRRLPG